MRRSLLGRTDEDYRGMGIVSARGGRFEARLKGHAPSKSLKLI
jgi:hypothetical protein